MREGRISYILIVSVSYLLQISCGNLDLNNPGDTRSSSFLITQALRCLAQTKQIICAPPTALNYSGSPFVFSINETITKITPTFGGAIAVCKSTPDLPTGLLLDNATCSISGMPSASVSATNYLITASNSIGNTTANISITVNSFGTVSQVSYDQLPINYGSAINVKLYSATPSAIFYYTTDGTTPTRSSNLYSSSISVSVNTTLKAIATKVGYADSPVGEANYTIGGSTTYAVGGWLSGLQGTIVLNLGYASGNQQITITGNGAFVFPKPTTNADIVTATVVSKPSSQNCRVDYDDTGSATNVTIAGANFLKVSVGCDNDTVAAATYSYVDPSLNTGYPADYITKDNATGRTWKTCSDGLSGAACTLGSLVTSTWINAGLVCRNLNDANGGAGFAGIKDWRMQSINELFSILNPPFSPKIEPTAFPATIGSSYWSATTNTGTPANAQYIAFNIGIINNLAKSSLVYVRCVSGP